MFLYKMDIRSTIWCMNPLNEPITEYGLKIADLRKKILFLKYIRLSLTCEPTKKTMIYVG